MLVPLTALFRARGEVCSGILLSVFLLRLLHFDPPRSSFRLPFGGKLLMLCLQQHHALPLIFQLLLHHSFLLLPALLLCFQLKHQFLDSRIEYSGLLREFRGHRRYSRDLYVS